MQSKNISIPAVAVGTVVYFVTGALWYSPLVFSNAWLVLIGKSFDEVKAHGAMPYPFALACAALATYLLAVTARAFKVASVLSGARLGLMFGLGMAAATAMPSYLFEGRPLSLLAINLGYPVVAMTLAGGVIGLWSRRGD